MNRKKTSVGADLTGWGTVIRKAGEDGRQKEAERKKASYALQEKASFLPVLDRIRVMLDGLDAGVLRTEEFVEGVRCALGDPTS